MANDPNRDLLPVREDNSKSGKGFNERYDHQLLAKLSRCELEDRFLRLLEDHNQLKKLVNCQEEKIKRLGTKLLRLINEKKMERKNMEHTKESEDLHLQIIELEHENYTLKDKNTVLKQQLASHSRHITLHRSPVRSCHTSPLMSMRQTTSAIQCDPSCEAKQSQFETTKNISSEAQLQEAEQHIKELNEEIKSLHCKIDFLEQNMERNCLDNRKTKVTENIELIRLQRSLKQQAIQIATLQAQVKNSENNQKMLKEELMKAHKENDDALQLISVKQGEILNLCSKLEEKKLNRLEEDELRQRINDLKLERDCLQERSDFLMKKIGAKVEESERVEELKKLLKEEKLKKEKLEQALAATKKCLLNIKIPSKDGNDGAPLGCDCSSPFMDYFPKEVECHSKKGVCKMCDTLTQVEVTDQDNVSLESSRSLKLSYCQKVEEEVTSCNFQESVSPVCKCSKSSIYSQECESRTEVISTATKIKLVSECEASGKEPSEGQSVVDKMKLERELQYLREMLRSQTFRCKAQQNEISRLMYELKVSEDKCNDTLRGLDFHLKIFQQMECRPSFRQIEGTQPMSQPIEQSETVKLPIAQEEPTNNVQAISDAEAKRDSVTQKSEDQGILSRSDSSEGPEVIERVEGKGSTSSSETSAMSIANTLTKKRSLESQPKKRFVEQVFLESSDEENVNKPTSERESFIRKLGEFENDLDVDAKRQNWTKSRSSSMSTTPFKTVNHSLGSGLSKSPSNSSFVLPGKAKLNKNRRDEDSEEKILPLSSGSQEKEKENYVEISILWLQLKESNSLWRNPNIKFLFIDFSFLDENGEETETPESLAKPGDPNDKCHFNFKKAVDITESRRKTLHSLLTKPDLDLVIFKVVSDPEDGMEMECEDVGVAVVTVKQFIENCGRGPFLIDVKNMNDTKEVVGTLFVGVDVTSGVFGK